MLGMAAQVRARETVDGYVETYMRRNPAAHKALEAVVMQLTERSDHLRFDHLGFVAFGGMDGPGYKPIADVFTGLGWQERDTFELENGLVTARWYQPPSVDFPMVVVRELRVDRFAGVRRGLRKVRRRRQRRRRGDHARRGSHRRDAVAHRARRGRLGGARILLAPAGVASHARVRRTRWPRRCLVSPKVGARVSRSGERAETHWHVAGANATVEDGERCWSARREDGGSRWSCQATGP